MSQTTTSTTTSRSHRPPTSQLVPARRRGADHHPWAQRAETPLAPEARRASAPRPPQPTSATKAPTPGKHGRPRTGTVRQWERLDGDFGFGVEFLDQYDEVQYERCGLGSEGWSRARAEVALEEFLQAVAEGTYTPTQDRSGTVEPDPLFVNWAAEVIAVHGDEVSENHRRFLVNIFTNHLKPEFQTERLSAVNRAKRLSTFRSKQLKKMRQIRRAAEKGTPLCREGGQPLSLGERTINHVFSVLAFILEKALWDDDIDVWFNSARNPALRVEVPKRSYRDWLEADELLSLLDAAELIDQPTRPATLIKAIEVRQMRKTMTVAQTAAALGISEGGVCYLCSRERVEQVSMTRTIIAVLGASGTRNTELCRLRPIDLDFIHSKIRIPRAKTAAGVREIDMTPWLQRQLETYVASLGPDYDPEAPLFPNRRGNHFDKDSLNKRLGRVHLAVGEMRRALRLPPLPTKLTAHVFRRTFITLMIEAGAPLSYVQKLVGHEDQATTVRIYNRVLKKRDTRRFGRAFDELMANAVPAELVAAERTKRENEEAEPFADVQPIQRTTTERSRPDGASRATTHTTGTGGMRMRMVVAHARAA
jgi:integrase